jgi:hypothetical protein
MSTSRPRRGSLIGRPCVRCGITVTTAIADRHGADCTAPTIFIGSDGKEYYSDPADDGSVHTPARPDTPDPFAGLGLDSDHPVPNPQPPSVDALMIGTAISAMKSAASGFFSHLRGSQPPTSAAPNPPPRPTAPGPSRPTLRPPTSAPLLSSPPVLALHEVPEEVRRQWEYHARTGRPYPTPTSLPGQLAVLPPPSIPSPSVPSPPRPFPPPPRPSASAPAGRTSSHASPSPAPSPTPAPPAVSHVPPPSSATQHGQGSVVHQWVMISRIRRGGPANS